MMKGGKTNYSTAFETVGNLVPENHRVYPRKLKGKFAAAAILPLHMAVSYCTSGLFRS